jgi:hypothetical protein
MQQLHAKVCPQELSQVIDDLTHAPQPVQAPISCAVLERWCLMHGVPVAGYEHGHPDAMWLWEGFKQPVADNPRKNSAPCRPLHGPVAAAAEAAWRLGRQRWAGGFGCDCGCGSSLAWRRRMPRWASGWAMVALALM